METGEQLTVQNTTKPKEEINNSLGEENKANNTNNAAKVRHFGLELCRIICMLFVICWHYLEVIIPFDSNILSMMFIVHCNTFFLISFYFLCKQKKFRLSKWVQMAGEILFYTIFSASIAVIMKEFQFDNPRHWFLVFLPITTNEYWFITAYFLLYFLSPFLNKIINHMSKGSHLLLVLFLTILFIFVNNFFRINAFGIGYGLCWMWALNLYFVSSYIRLYVDVKNINIFLLLGIFITAAFLHTLLASLLKYGIDNQNEFVLNVFSEEYTYFRRYNNFLTLITSISFFLIFLKINFSNKVIQKIISFVSRHSLASYLIHCSPFLSYHFSFGAWQLAFEMQPYRWLGYICFVLIIFFGSLLVDSIRGSLVMTYSRSKWYQRMMENVDALPYILINKINKKSSSEV